MKNGIFCSWIDLSFVEEFDKERMNDSSYIKEVVSVDPEVKHYSAFMKDNRTFTDCNWEE